MHQQRLLAQQCGTRPSPITNSHTHSQGPKRANAGCSGTVLRSHARLPHLDFSNKNNYCPLQHMGLSICLGQRLRLVSVIEINCFEQAWADRKDQRHEGSEGLADEDRGPGEHPLITTAPWAETRQLHWGGSQTHRDVWVEAEPHTLPNLAVFSRNCPSSMKGFPLSPRLWGWDKFNFQG